MRSNLNFPSSSNFPTHSPLHPSAVVIIIIIYRTKVIMVFLYITIRQQSDQREGTQSNSKTVYMRDKYLPNQNPLIELSSSIKVNYYHIEHKMRKESSSIFFFDYSLHLLFHFISSIHLFIFLLLVPFHFCSIFFSPLLLFSI